MTLLRCPRCGEIADSRRETSCRGCGLPLPEPHEEQYAKRLQVAAAQQEAGRDVKASTVVLLVIGVLFLGGLVGLSTIWSLIGLLVLAVALSASATSGVVHSVLRGLAIAVLAMIVLGVGAFVFLWIVCLSSDWHIAG